MPKPLAKSLHTVTVLVRVARSNSFYNARDYETALECALRVLGYDGAPDPYGLAAAALAQLKASAK